MEYNGAVNNLVGKKVYGYCNGYFGRDSYDDKVIIMNGLNWIVAIPSDGLPEIAYFDDNKEMIEWFENNSKNLEDND